MKRNKRLREDALMKAREAQEATPKKPRALRDYGDEEPPAAVEAPPAPVEEVAVDVGDVGEVVEPDPEAAV